MKQVKIIEPDARKNSDMECRKCGLKYTQQHYRILRDAKKLIYFSLDFDGNPKVKPVCHQCLREAALELNNNEPTEVEIHSKLNKKTIHTFYANSRDRQEG